MPTGFKAGDCVRLRDGRIGRVRGRSAAGYRVRVLRKTSSTHVFVVVPAEDLAPAECPPGWMSPRGYLRYLRVTLAKMRQRQARKRSRPSKSTRKRRLRSPGRRRRHAAR